MARKRDGYRAKGQVLGVVLPRLSKGYRHIREEVGAAKGAENPNSITELAMLWDDEAYERLAINALECGTVGEALQVARERNWLPAEERNSLIRSNFEGMVAEMYFTSKAKHASDLLITEEPDAQLREQFKQYMEQHWPEWQEVAAKMTDNELLDEQAEIAERGNALGILSRQAKDRRVDRQQNGDIQERMRRLVAEHSTEGQAALERYTGSDLLLLLSAKQLHVDDVSRRLTKGQDPIVNWRLKGILEGQVREVVQAVQKKGINLER